MSGALSWTPVQVPDFGATMARAQQMQANRLQMLAQQRQLQQGQQMDDFLAQNAEGFASSDPTKRMNLLAMLAQQGPQGLQVALPQMQALREEQQLAGALPLLGQGGASASPGAPATNPAPGGTSRATPSRTASTDLPVEARAFLDTIAGPESRGAYNVRWGGPQGPQTFDSFAAHPGIMAPGPQGPSSAAGRYQFVRSTWDPLAQRYGARDFSPQTQDRVAWSWAQDEYRNSTGRDLLADLRDPARRGDVQRVMSRPSMWTTANMGAYDANLAAYGGDAPRTIPTAADGAEPPAAAEGGPTPPQAAGGAPAPITPQAASALNAPGGLTAENLQRFVIAARGNPTAMRIAQSLAPLIRQGAATEIREVGAQAGRPAGLYAFNSQTGQPVAYLGPPAETRMQTVNLGAGPHGPAGTYQVTADSSAPNGYRYVRLGDQAPPATQVAIDQRGQSAYDQERGRTLAQEETSIRAGLGMANQTLARLGTIERNLDRITTGVGSGTRLTLGQVANQLGVPEAVMTRLGIDPNAVASGETIRSQSSQLLLGMLGPGGFPTQGFSNADREMLERALPSLGNSPNGNRAIIQVMRAAAERQREIAVAWADWRRQHGANMESFDRFQLERLPQITDRDVMAPILGDYIPGGGNTGGGNTGPATQVPIAAPVPPPAPAVGTIQDGYRFLGGNPASQSSWERVQ